MSLNQVHFDKSKKINNNKIKISHLKDRFYDLQRLSFLFRFDPVIEKQVKLPCSKFEGHTISSFQNINNNPKPFPQVTCVSQSGFQALASAFTGNWLIVKNSSDSVQLRPFGTGPGLLMFVSDPEQALISREYVFT